MAVGQVGPGSITKQQRPMVVPVANESAWVVVCTAATTADNSGSTVLDPSAITRSAQNWFLVNGTGTTLQVCLRYTPGAAGTSPVVQVFGRDVVGGSGAVYQRLKDASGAHELTLTVDATNDVKSVAQGYAWTSPVEVDINCNVEVLVAVKTAQDLDTDTIDDILVRVK